MTQPPVPPDEEPIGGSLTPKPGGTPEPEASQPGSAPPPPPEGSSFPPPPPPTGGIPADGYPPSPPPSSPPGNAGGYPTAPPEGYYPPAFPSGVGGSFGSVGLKPHRANLVLTLGIVGLLCCNPLSIPAFLLAKKDLEEMDAGVMDPTGRSTTNIGRILGIVGMVFLGISLVYLVIALLTAAS